MYDITRSLTAYASYSRFLTAQTALTYTGGLLPPRSGEQYEVGLKSSFLDNRVTTTVALFHINDNNRAITDPNNPTGSIAGGKSTGEGFEFEVAGQPLPDWNVYAGYTYLNVNYENDQPDLTTGTDPNASVQAVDELSVLAGRVARLLGGRWRAGADTHLARRGTGRLRDLQCTGRLSVQQAPAGVAQSEQHLQSRLLHSSAGKLFYSEFGQRRNLMLTVRSDF
ncbi:outer membrane receptor for ferric coprogen and ferric-rhodotorulic acid [Candidatus Paraburkholderia kirkii]|nr:outer membrane receptor for ferric coprogen and ferric-rhodotorulic acid [Candidatus Paraburkholderia kirkii]